MDSEKKLSILMVENSAEDAEQICNTLREGGLWLDYQRVASLDALRDALLAECWDIVLSDYSLPEFGIQDVLQVLSDQGLTTPAIVVSTHMNENAAASIMALGVCDFVMKANMARLIPAIRRSLHDIENCRRIAEAQSALQKSEALFQAITSNLPGVVFQFLLEPTHQMSFPYVSDASETLLGISPQTLMDSPELFPALILSDDKESYDQLMMTSAEQLSTWNWEGCIQVKGDSDIKWVSLRATPRKIPDGATLWDGIMINITRNKLAEHEIAHSREQLAELSSYLQKAKEHERARIAREIHDDIGGTLTAIKCELLPCIDAATPRTQAFFQKKAASIESLVDRVIDSTRRISLDLRPGILDCGIVAAVQWQAKEFSNRTSISCRVSCENDEIMLDSDLSVAIFRVFQETLTNIAKHADASRIQVKLEELDGLVLLEVLDNGRGITSLDMGKQDSFGIRGMRERCMQLKGSFHISGNPEKGTKVTILIPTGDLEQQMVNY